MISLMIFLICINLGRGGVLEKIEGGCQPNGIYCKSSTSYTFCTNIVDVSLILVTEYFCPDGYFCTEEGNHPCISGDDTTTTTTPAPTTTTETTTTTEPTTTTTELTTTTTEPTTTTTEPTTTTTEPTTTTTELTTTTVKTTKAPITAPNCYYHEYYPGPTCSEFYECVAVWWWWESRLRTCDAGLYYSETTKTCVDPASSGCTN